MRRLMAHSWPGNVRQLENAIERAVAFSGGRGQIAVEDLPPEFSAPASPALQASLDLPEDGVDLNRVLAGLEGDLIRRSLERTGGNKGQAARLLRINRTTLVEKLRRLGS
jgi:DNA-binding NtrC family response regulator